jgi:DNA-binding LacI/PurR family transcriptional regulator
LPKIDDVAKRAGVSTATVSAVVNGQNTVETKTRRRVLAAIRKLNYQPNLYASNLARGRTRLLGVIISDIVNPFFGEIVLAIRRQARARGYEIWLTSTQFSPEDLLAAVRRMIGMRVAGLAIMTTEMNEQVLEVLRNHRVPAIFEDVGTVNQTLSNIRIDYEGGIFKAVKYLLDLGHRRILYVGSYPDPHMKEKDFLSIRLRTDAFHAAVRRFQGQGLKPHIVTCPGPGPEAGLQAIRQAHDQYSFTAAIAIADPVALGVLRGLNELGLAVPRDVSLVGFDNSYICDYLSPPLTSVNIPRDKLGEMVVDCLVRNVEQQEPGRSFALETELIVRESVTRPSERKSHNTNQSQARARVRIAPSRKVTPPPNIR